MLIGHAGNVLQIQVRQQVIGNFIADYRAVGLLVMHQQPERQHRDNLFIQGAQNAQLIAGASGDGNIALATRLRAEGAVTKQRQGQQTDIKQQRQQNILQGIQQQRTERHLPDQTHAGGVQRGGNLDFRAIKGDRDAIRAFFVRRRAQVLRCGVLLQTEAFERHIRGDQIVNRQIEGHHRRQMARLIKGGAQGKVVAILPGQPAQGREAFALVQGIGLLQHLCAPGVDYRADRGLFKTGREIFQRQGGDQDHAVVLTVEVVHRPGNRLRAPQRIEIGRHALGHLQRGAVVGAKDQGFGFAPRFLQIVDILLQARLLQSICG